MRARLLLVFVFSTIVLRPAGTAAQEVASFVVEETPPYVVRGRYSGDLVTHGDTLWVNVEYGVLTYHGRTGQPSRTLEFISAALLEVEPTGVWSFVRRGSRVPMALTLAPADEVEIGPFGIRILYQGSLGRLHLSIVHRFIRPDGGVAEAYTRFDQPLEILLARAVPLR